MYNQRQVERFLEVALKSLEDCFKDPKYNDMLQKKDNDKAHIKSTYESYAAALGPVLIQMGILPGIAFYLSGKENSGSNGKSETKEKGDSKERRDLIAELLAKTCGRTSAVELFNHYKNSDDKDRKKLKIEIESATVALKLAIRTYDLI
jgi:CRISPR/Cas system CMR-associated protein Cmr5 small subunit